jgi:hypothetical protein
MRFPERGEPHMAKSRNNTANGDLDDRVGVGRGRQNGASRRNGNVHNARAAPVAGPAPPTDIALGAPGQGWRGSSPAYRRAGIGRSECQHHAGAAERVAAECRRPGGQTRAAALPLNQQAAAMGLLPPAGPTSTGLLPQTNQTTTGGGGLSPMHLSWLLVGSNVF